MTVIADNKKRVVLPTKPGERFDIQIINSDKFVLTRLAPVEQPRPRLMKKNGRTVLKGARKLTQAEVNRELEEFP
jgi:hypothetical protein